LFALFCTLNAKAQITIVLQPDSTTGNDTFILDYYPNNTYGNEDRLDITAWTQFGAPYISRALIHFDLSSIPVGATVSSAYLSLFHNPSSALYNGIHAGANAFALQRIISAWHEDSTNWNNQPAVTTANQVLFPATVSGTQDFTNIDVTAMVNDMVNLPNSNFGFMVRLQSEVHYADLLIAPSNHADTSVHPKLVISYLATGLDVTDIVDLNIWPNPFSDELNVVANDKNIFEMILNDIASRKLLQQNFTSSCTLNTEDFLQGLYLYEIRDNKGWCRKGKLMKN
jgi:hypothetical protein